MSVEATFGTKPSSKSIDFQESSSEIGLLFERYLAHTHRQMMEARSKEEKGPLLPTVDPKTVCDKEMVRRGNKTHAQYYANAGKTPEAMDAVRQRNQNNSSLLKLPTEILIMIWKSAFESIPVKRAHGTVSRQVSGHGMLSLIHTCSLLRNVLYPVFVGQDAIVVKVSSSDSSIAAKELMQWWDEVTRTLTLNLDKTIKPLILLTLQVGWLPLEDAITLAAKVQTICSTAQLFRPKVLVETVERSCYYCGPGALMRLQAPPMEFSWEDRYQNGRQPTTFDAPPLCHDDKWKGWAAIPVTEQSLACTKSQLGPRSQFDSRWYTYNSEVQMLASCKSFVED